MEGSLRLWLISACNTIDEINSTSSNSNSSDDDSDKLLIIGRYLFSLEKESATLMDLYTNISTYFNRSNSNTNNLMKLLSSSSSAIAIAIEACLIFAVSADSINRYLHIPYSYNSSNYYNNYYYY